MRRALIALIVASSVACLGGGIVGSSTVTGDYTLRTIDGSSLPYTVAGSGTVKTEIVDDVVTLYEGFTYARLRHSRTTTNGQVTNASITDTGSFSLLGNSISLRSNDGSPLKAAVIAGNTMTIVESGLTEVFKK